MIRGGFFLDPGEIYFIGPPRYVGELELRKELVFTPRKEYYAMRPRFDPPKEPLPIYIKNSAGEFVQQDSHVCAHCLYIKIDRDAAYDCCKQLKCGKCGVNVDYHSNCLSCRDAAELARATEIDHDTYTGPVYDDSGDRYFETLDEFYDHYADDEDMPEWVYACDVDKLKDENAASIVDTMIENLVDDHHEEAKRQVEATPELIAAVRTWLDAQTVESWMQNTKLKIRTKPEEKPDEPARSELDRLGPTSLPVADPVTGEG